MLTGMADQLQWPDVVNLDGFKSCWRQYFAISTNTGANLLQNHKFLWHFIKSLCSFTHEHHSARWKVRLKGDIAVRPAHVIKLAILAGLGLRRRWTTALNIQQFFLRLWKFGIIKFSELLEADRSVRWRSAFISCWNIARVNIHWSE